MTALHLSGSLTLHARLRGHGVTAMARPIWLDTSSRRSARFPHATDVSGSVGICAAIDMPADATGAPEWVHLLPAGDISKGKDCPYV
ncbi:hypothetical protein [Aminobacter sp. MDW-2]|uniref:hypothetical protein n=1 Tax=Aminobacter sp. MDW-2 TaxID=2666139 RepID=UPI0012B0ED7A|nr:hypothetical protein [Aminobacter sp. MDW-2]MRX37234.1 hypothetical protein [Aminobacter sp. MDW-2]QNH33244.1 hypothetical protein H5P29_22430 [Aminobacter sp. MDW-2]